MSYLPHTCGRCPSRWAGSRTAHCPSCHTTFSGVTGFDKHRNNGKCLKPQDIGLSLLEGRSSEVWGEVRDEE